MRVDAAPSPVTPRQIPSRARRLRRRDVVDTRSAPRLAAQQARQGHPSAAPQSETLDGFVTIDRACRQMPAIVANQRRQRVAVNPDQSATGIARKALHRCGAVRAARTGTRQWKLHGLDTVIVRTSLSIPCTVLVRFLQRFPQIGTDELAFAPHFRKYRMFWVALQQRFYGRCGFARLPF